MGRTPLVGTALGRLLSVLLFCVVLASRSTSCAFVRPAVNMIRPSFGLGFTCQAVKERKLTIMQGDTDGSDESFTPINAAGDLNEKPDPPFSFRRKSLLFSENDESVPLSLLSPNVEAKSSTAFLSLWRGAKSTLPPLVTGAWESRGDDFGDNNSGGSVYNLIFVRIPAIAAGLIYGKNLVMGHPLVMDFGHGPFEMNPLVVAGLLWILLL